MSDGVTIRPAAYEHAPFLRPLAELSAVMGRDLTQVQGPGGNTSLKRDGVLWVKASGTDLAEADERCIFVPVDMAGARETIRAGDERPIAVLEMEQAEGMRPSIECSLHALMPHPIVVHNHDVNVIAWAARADAESALAERMQGLNWAFVRYARPGLPLTKAVCGVLKAQSPDILILGNHGLVVGAQTPGEATGLLAAIRDRLELVPRRVEPRDPARLEALCAGTRFEPASLPEAHWTALDATALRVATGGALYPDHVVFLGAEPVALSSGASEKLEEIAARLVAVPGTGVLIERNLPPAAHAMAACLGLVSARFEEEAQVAYLGTEDIAALLGWDAERFRQEQARRKAMAGVRG